MYKCNECDAVFAKRDKLVLHSTVHAAENYACSLCKETFDNAADIDEHIKLHSEGDQFACEYCDLMFLTSEQLQAHSVKEHTHDNELYEVDNVSMVDSQSSDFPGEESIGSAAEESNVDDGSISSIVDDSSEKSTPKQRTIAKPAKSPVKVSPVAKESPPARKPRPTTAPRPATTVAKSTATKTPPAKPQPQPQPTPPKSKGNIPTTSAKLQTAKSAEPQLRKVLSIRGTDTEKGMKKAENIKEIIAKKSPPQTSMKNFITVKARPNASSQTKDDPLSPPKAGTTVTTMTPKTVTMMKVPTTQIASATIKPSNSSPPKTTSVPDPKALGMQIVGKPVKVQQVRMTKADIEALKREGKIQMHNGKMIIKQSAVPKKT